MKRSPHITRVLGALVAASLLMASIGLATAGASQTDRASLFPSDQHIQAIAPDQSGRGADPAVRVKRRTPTPTPTRPTSPTPTPTASPSPTPTAPSTAPSAKPTLLSRYIINGPQPDYPIVRYQPRQFIAGRDVDPGDTVARVDDPGPYAGWDVLNTPNREISRILDLSTWLRITTSRSATLAIVWRGGTPLPSWLSGWSRGQDVVINGVRTPTYVRSVGVGDVALGSVYDPNTANRFPRDTYLVLVGEADGKSSAAPAVPAGREVPQPNQTCPQWVHDQYVTTGPDGKTYPTWHPPIDPVYWCYFHHEHGSDPGPYKPAFGYTAGMSEAHEGFKVYKITGPGDVTAIITHHFGTGNAVKAACARFHTFDLAMFKAGTLVADLHLMADHGKSVHARTGTDLTPTACPNQAAEADADGSLGVRKFQVATMDPVAYEPWFIDFSKVIVGIAGGGFGVNTPSRITDCNTLNCDANVPTGDQGEFRFFSYGGQFGVIAGRYTGVFYTDPEGRTLKAPGDAGAVQQFVAPGANATLPALTSTQECYTIHPFGGPYVCQETGPLGQDFNLEGSFQSPN